MSLSQKDEERELSELNDIITSLNTSLNARYSSAPTPEFEAKKQQIQQIISMLDFFNKMLHEKGEQEFREITKKSAEELEKKLFAISSEKNLEESIKNIQEMIKAQIAKALSDTIQKLEGKIQELSYKIDSLKETSKKLDKQIDILEKFLTPNAQGKLNANILDTFMKDKSDEIAAIKMSIVNNDGVYNEKDLIEPQKQFFLVSKINSKLKENPNLGAGDPLVRKLEAMKDDMSLQRADIKAEIDKSEKQLIQIRKSRSEKVEDLKKFQPETKEDKLFARLRS